MSVLRMKKVSYFMCLKKIIFSNDGFYMRLHSFLEKTMGDVNINMTSFSLQD